MTPDKVVKATREGAGLFEMSSRGRLLVRGGDRVRWLDGMISGDIEALEAGEDGSGCYAMLLTNRGKIVADLHVGRLGESYVLESLAAAIPRIESALDRFIIADDVDLVAEGESDHALNVALGLEGPKAEAILTRALGSAPPARNDWQKGVVGGQEILIAGFGFSGEVGFQLYLEASARAEVEAALDDAFEGDSIVRGDAGALETLRIEAGLPMLDNELSEEVLPPEAHLEHGISTTKGCYVGQEIVARLRARGQVNHLLVGIQFEGADAPPPVGTLLSSGDKSTGRITSVTISPTAGSIGLGFVRREHAEAGTTLDYSVGQGSVGQGRVTALPFVELAAAAP